VKKKQRPTEYEKPLKIDASFDDAMKAITQDENEIRVLDFSEKTNEIEVKPIKYGQLIFTTLLPNFLPNGTFLEIKIQSNIIESHPLSLSDFYNPIPDNKEVKLIRNDGIPVKYNIPQLERQIILSQYLK